MISNEQRQRLKDYLGDSLLNDAVKNEHDDLIRKGIMKECTELTNGQLEAYRQEHPKSELHKFVMHIKGDVQYCY